MVHYPSEHRRFGALIHMGKSNIRSSLYKSPVSLGTQNYDLIPMLYFQNECIKADFGNLQPSIIFNLQLMSMSQESAGPLQSDMASGRFFQSHF